MNGENVGKSPHRLWAEFRFSVVGHLLAAPPGRGDLARELRRLSEKNWRHPLSGNERCFKFSTIEGWYYTTKNAKKDPVGQLRSKTRDDLGKSRRLGAGITKLIVDQYAKFPFWSYQLHHDNLAAIINKNSNLGSPPSYPTIRRYMKNSGLTKRRKAKTSGQVAATNRLANSEVRSYEVEHVNALWHLDYHHSPLKVLTEDGTWQTPIVLGVFDDHSRLCCHIQWYLAETAENLVHAFVQGIMKRGLPRELMSDNGSAMISAEFSEGLVRLGICPQRTLPFSPYQNGKCEFAWQKVDGRLMAMLDGYKDLTLGFLNDVTQAWSEMEYNRKVHSETGQTPIDRFISGKDVSRPSPSSHELTLAFQREITRRQRKSDGTIVIDRIRFEVPSRFRHQDKLLIKYAFWDLSHVYLADTRTGLEIAKLYPLDKAKNADGQRRSVEDPINIEEPMQSTELPALLQSLIDDYDVLGIRPAYLPQTKWKVDNHDDQ